MNLRIIGLCLLVVGLSLPTVMAQAGGQSEWLPPNAEAGHCYAPVFAPPAYRTETQSVLKHEAYEEIEIIPASFEWTEDSQYIGAILVPDDRALPGGIHSDPDSARELRARRSPGGSARARAHPRSARLGAAAAPL